MTLIEPERLDADEVKCVARGLVEGRVFTADMCPPDMIGMVFMVVGMGGLANYDLDKVGNIYEWLDRAGERGINGMPMFMSCKVAHVDDWPLVVEMAKVIDDAIQAALG